MSEDTNKPRLGVVPDAPEVELVIVEEPKEIPTEATELAKFRNLKLYLNKQIGDQWMLMYKRKEDGAPVYVPNEALSPEDQVFLSELSKNIVFQMMIFSGESD